MKPFSKKDIIKKADTLSDPFTPYEEVDERGKKQISKYDSEYLWLLDLIKLVVKEGVPPQEIKDLSLSMPFVTVDDVGDLASKIWTLATEKYGISRNWLIRKLPEKKASLKKANKVYDEEWQSQKETQDMLDHQPGYLAYQYGQDKTATPETDHDLYLSMGQDVIDEYFFGKSIRWSQVVSFLKEQVPQLSDDDIITLKTDTKMKLSQFGQQINAAKKKIASDDLTQFALADKEIRNHFKNRSTSIEEVLSSLPNFSIKYIPKELEKQDPTLASGKAGFYDFKSGTLYINPRLTLDNKRLTIIHEIEHAIQDASGVLPVHTNEDLNQVKKTPYMDRTFEWGARQQQFNALKARGMSLEEIVEFLVKRTVSMTGRKYDEYELNYIRDNVRNEVEQMNDINEEMMPESIMASKTAKKKKPFTIDKVIQTLNSKEPKVVRIDPIKLIVELEDGSVITFDEAIKKALEIDKTGEVFQGSEFSTTDWGVNPSLGSGPFDSPADHGATDQELVWPNTNWLPMDDENKDEQPYSNIASSLKLQSHCGPCAIIKAEVIKMLADLKYKDESVKAEDLEELAKLSADPSNNSFIQELGKIIQSLPEEHDKEIQKLKNHKLALEDIQKDIDNGDMKADKPFSKKALLKKADLGGQTVNKILQGLEIQGIVNYNLSTGQFLPKEEDDMAMIQDRTKVVENVVDFDEIESYIQSNMDLLQNPNNIFRAMTNNGTVYLGVANMVPVQAFSKKHFIKKAEESLLSQEDQNEIAAKWDPIMNIALNNYAQAVKNGHDIIRALKFAEESVINIGGVKESNLKEAIEIYLKGLV